MHEFFTGVLYCFVSTFNDVVNSRTYFTSGGNAYTVIMLPGMDYSSVRQRFLPKTRIISLFICASVASKYHLLREGKLSSLSSQKMGALLRRELKKAEKKRGGKDL